MVHNANVVTCPLTKKPCIGGEYNLLLAACKAVFSTRAVQRDPEVSVAEFEKLRDATLEQLRDAIVESDPSVAKESLK